MSTLIYRFDMNLRDATVLGLVGAGGIGAPLIFAMSSYRWNEVGAILLGLILLVLVIETFSARIRAMENRLLTRERMDRMIDGPGRLRGHEDSGRVRL